MKRFVACAAFALATAPAHAQTLVWEYVGDRASGATRPSIAPNGTMWSGGREGLDRLDPPYGPTSTWTSIGPLVVSSSDVLALGQDTLIASTNVLYRSVDSGETFTRINGVGLVNALYEIPFGLPHGGTLVGELPGRFAVYSHDRGATWAKATVPDSQDGYPVADDMAIVLRGEHAGRIVGAGLWGLAVSDNGGVSYAAVSGRWQRFRYDATAVGVLDRAAPGGGDRVVAAMIDPQRPGRISLVLVSDDGGDTWRETFALTGDPNAAASGVVDFGGGRAVIVMDGGHVWQTTDAGESWAIVGIVPGALVDPAGSPTSGRVIWALRGPDGRLYVGGDRLGSANPGWAFRTVAPIVASEVPPGSTLGSGPEVAVAVRPNPAGGRAEVVLSLSEASAVRAVVVDALGREVAVVLDGPAAAGERVVGVDVASWPAGVYVVRVTAGAQTATARLVVAR